MLRHIYLFVSTKLQENLGMKLYLLCASTLILMSISAYAQTQVQFTNKELAAAFVLIRPELNSIEMNDRTGVFTPSPALRFFGLGDPQFDIDSSAVQLADIEFDHLKSKPPSVSFEAGALVLNVPLEDKIHAIHSRLGSISTVGVVLSANAGWTTLANGTQVLGITSVQMTGRLQGTGALAPNFVLNQVRALVIKILTRLLSQQLASQNIQDQIQKGLLTWSKFYTGVEYHSIVPGSINFYSTGTDSGLQFQVQ
jgi:hypothetical protein